MKKTIIFSFLISSLSMLGQTKTTYISKQEIGPLHCSYSCSIKETDTAYMIFISYQNEEYQSITDLKHIAFFLPSNIERVQKLAENISNAIKDIGTKKMTTYDDSKYHIQVMDFSDKIFIYEPTEEGEGHTEITIGQAQDLIKWLNSCIKK